MRSMEEEDVRIYREALLNKNNTCFLVLLLNTIYLLGLFYKEYVMFK